MKRKFSKILGVGLTLALITSLLLVAAPVSAFTQPTVVPTSATISATTSYAITTNLGTELGLGPPFTLVDAGDGTAEWSTDNALLGSYSAKLIGGATTQDGSNYAAVVIDLGGTMTLAEVTDFIYNYTFAAAGTFGPHMCFYVHNPLDDTEKADINLYSGGGVDTPAEVGLNTVDLMDIVAGGASGFFWIDTGPATISGMTLTANLPNTYTLAEFQATGLTEFGDWIIDRIQIEYGWWSAGDASVPAYVDEVTLNTTTYNLEPLYTLESSTGGTAVWSTTQKRSGTQSAKLTKVDGTGSTHVEFAAAGITLSNFQAAIAATTPKWSFWHYREIAGVSNGPQFELRFEAPDSPGWLEVTAVGLQGTTGTELWVEEILAGATLAGYGGCGEAGPTASFFNWGPLTLLSGIESAVNGETNVTDSASDWVLTRVRVELWEATPARTCYIDDVTIDGALYDLEEVSTPQTITITFPSTTVVPATVPGATLVASPGWIGGVWKNAITTGVTFASVAATRTVTATLGAGDEIGEGATVRIGVPGITNPPTIGSYTLTVKTSAETTAVASAAYAITTPTILPLAGVVERYNSVDVLMEQTSSITTAIANASAGDTLRVGPGTYDEDIDVDESITLIGDAATTIIKDTDGDLTGGMVTISFEQTALLAGVVFDGFTVMGDLGGANALSITGIGVTVQNCVFTKPGTATSAVGQTMVVVNPGDALVTTYGNTITNCTFDTTLGAKQDTGIDVQNGFGENTTISNCTFLVDAVTVGTTEDTAIAIADGTALKPVTVTDCIISGASGNGIVVTTADAIVKITDSTLSNLSQALSVTLGKVTVSGCTIDTCGLATSTTLGITAQAAIAVASTAGLSITNNTITSCPNDIIQVTADSDKVNMMFNNLTENVLGIDNNDPTTNILNATHNWWGVDTGPATGLNVELSTTLGQINTASYLGGEATGNFALAAAALITKTTVGVDVTATGTLAPAIIGVANYAVNPQDATPLPALAGGFYDVYLADATGSLTTSVLIKFYNANVTANTDIYVWGTLAGGWVLVTPATAQGVNLYGGYAWVKVTTASVPSVSDLTGTPFALVEAPLGALTAPLIKSPDLGERDIPLTPTFAWTQIAAADAYYFELADNANFVLPMVKLDGDLGRLIVTAYAHVGELSYFSAYYWRVKAVSGTAEAGNLAESPWATGVFITMDEPEEPTPPIVVEEAPTLPDITITQPDITITQPDVIVPQAEIPITPTWIYVIIGVGAVLVIAVITLIVRTRRVA